MPRSSSGSGSGAQRRTPHDVPARCTRSKDGSPTPPRAGVQGSPLLPDDLSASRPRPVLLRELGSGLLRIGYVPLTDAAPLLVAEALGLFGAVGLRVALSAETAWAALRDKIAFGGLDAAQVLGPMPIALACGLGGVRRRLTVGAGLGVNGNRLVLSNALAAELGDFAPPLAAIRFAGLLRARAAAGRPPVRLAVVFPFSSHNYLLRHWLASGGLDPDRELRLVVVPPSRAADALASGAVDGFCAGEPWGSLATLRGAGRIVLTSGDIWPGHPEKMLAFAEGFVARDREAALACTAAVIAAARWLDEPGNRGEALAILGERGFPGLPADALAPALDGALPDGTALAPGARLRFRPATLPRREAARWWLGQMRRWGHLPADAAASPDPLAAFDDGLWREAAARLSEPEPDPLPTEPNA